MDQKTFVFVSRLCSTYFSEKKFGSNCRIPRSKRSGGEGPRVYASSFFSGWIIERCNFLCAGYASTRGYASNLKLRVLVFVVFCHGACIIERGNFLCAGYASTRGYASNLKLRVPVFVVFCHGACIIERGNFLCAG